MIKWNFFDNADAEIKLEIRSAENEVILLNSEWIEGLPQIRRSLKNLILNPTGNFIHCCYHLLEDIQNDILTLEQKNSQSIEQSARYTQLQSVVRQQLTESHQSHIAYQFRICVLKLKQKDILLESKIEWCTP